QPLDCLKALPTQHFTKPPARYTEASLVKTLEREGIGRPSTYAQIISTIQERGYTEVKDKAFYAKELGIVTNDALLPFFDNIINTKYTSQLEERLDDIGEGKGDWQAVLREFYEPFKADLERAEAEMPSVKEKIAADTDEVCPKCGEKMVVRLSRRGRFLGCSAYPTCRYTQPMDEDGEPVPVETIEEKCPECGGELHVRTGRKGKFVGCTGYPKCRYTREYREGGAAGEDDAKPRPAPKPLGEDCPLCSQPLVERVGRRGAFVGCSGYPKCRFTRPIEGEQAEEPEATDEKCEKCGKPMAVKSGRRGRFLACSGYPDCKSTKPIDKAGPAPKTEEAGRACPECGKPLLVREGRRGKFIACSGYPKCRHTENVEDAPETPSDDGDAEPAEG
ncbi:topoisomerase DNA-binding C4 zinc finger domain-containing protein, partial [bacterium]|nr:topoisomerase DNA-binding C4 zinc finger domain-containing protein [bacterium]